MALNGLHCADVPSRNYSLTHTISVENYYRNPLFNFLQSMSVVHFNHLVLLSLINLNK